MSRARIVLAVVGLLAALHAASFIGYGPCDDDYITYRYARNLIEGHGLVYNLGERVEGFSAPGWTLTVALALRLGIEPARFSVIVSIAAAAVAAWSIGALWLRRHPREHFVIPALLVAASPAIAWHAIVGLGTVVLAALIALAFELWDRALARNERALGAAIVFGLAALWRNEAVLCALPFCFVELRRGRWSSAWPALAPLVAWQAFRVAYYGRWVPTTYSVKKLAFLADMKLGLEYLALSTGATGIAIAVALGLIVLTRRTEARDAALRAGAVACAAFTLYVVYVGGDFVGLARFFVPILPLALLLACEGVAAALGQHRRAGVALALLALVVLQVPQRERERLKERYDESEQRWELLGREIAREVPATTKVALAPIGAFGYESRLYIVDMLGLTNTAIANAPPDPEVTIKGHQRYDADWVLAQAPEMIILGNGWLHPGADGRPVLIASAWEKTLVEHARFHAEYEPLRLEIAGSYPLIFYWRKGVARPPNAVPA